MKNLKNLKDFLNSYFQFKPLPTTHFWVISIAILSALIVSLILLFFPRNLIDPKSIINESIVRQTSDVVSVGQPVKWTVFVKRSSITSSKKLLKLPKSATDIKIQLITKNQAEEILSRHRSSIKQTSLADKKIKKPNILSASVSDAVESIVAEESPAPTESPAEESIIHTPDATIVDLSAQAPIPTEPVPVPETSGQTVTVPEEVSVDTTTEVPQLEETVVVVSSTTEETAATTTETLQPISFTGTGLLSSNFVNSSSSTSTSALISTSTATSTPSSLEEVVQIDYTTPAPQIKTENTDTGKLVTISSEDEDLATPLLDVVASTTIPEVFKVGQENKIKIKWKNEGNQDVTFHAYDTNGNGKLDLVEWTVPHLSEQIFEIILISKAFRLDANREITEDIYDVVATQDNDWITIQNNEWLRFTFEAPVDKTKNIDIYAKPANPNEPAIIEVYRENGNEVIATFNIDREFYYHSSMANLGDNPAEVFDFKIVGNVDIDYVQDANPYFMQTFYQIFKDDGTDLNTGKTAYAAQNTNYNYLMDVPFRIRFVLEDDDGGINDISPRLEFSENSGAWTQITTSSNNVRLFDSAVFTDGASTTKILTYNWGTPLLQCQGKDTGSDVVPACVGALGATWETEYSLKFEAGAIGKSYQFRITNAGAALDTYQATPTIAPAYPANVYWVGGEGNWSDAAHHWAVTSGGAPTEAALPRTTTIVNFDANSGTGTVTVDSTATVSQFILNKAGITVSLSNPLTVNTTATFTSGTVAVGTNTLTLSGAVTVTSGTITSDPTGTVIFNRNDVQNIPGGTYGNLSLSALSLKTKTLIANATVNGTLTISFVTLYYTGTKTLTLNGPVIYSGSSNYINAYDGTVIYGSASEQTIVAGVYRNLTSSDNSTRILAPGGTIIIYGTFTQGVNTAYTTTGSTVAITSYPSCVVPALSYNNFEIWTSCSLQGDTTVNGLLTLDESTLDVGPYTLTINGTTRSRYGGDVTDTGGAGTVRYDYDGDVSVLPGTYGNLIINGSGTKTLYNISSILGNLTVSGGIFNANAKILGVTGLTTISGGTYLPSTAIQTLTGGLNFTSGTITQSTGAINLGSDLTITSGAGTTFTKNASGLLKFKSGTATQKLTSGGKDLGNIQISANTTNTTLTLQDNLNADIITIDANQTLDVGSNRQINVGSNWTNNGTFNSNSGTVVFDGTSQTISGTNNFFNFSAITPDQIITFPYNYTTTVAGTFLVEGSSGHNIKLKSSQTGTDGSKASRARLDITATADNHSHDYIQYATIYDNDASHGTSVKQQNSTDGGNNVGWFNISPTAPTLVYPENNLATSTNTVTLSALYQDNDTGDTGTTNYRISSSGLADCTNNTNVVAFGASAATPDASENTTWTSSALTPDGTYYWCAQNNDGVAQSAWTQMGSFIIDTTPPTITGLSNDTTPAKSKTWTWSSNDATSTYRYLIDQTPGSSPSGEYSSAVTANQSSGNGNYYLHVQAKDLLGNESSVTTVSAILDNIAPVVTSNANGEWHNSGFDVTLTCTDTNGSGCGAISYCTYLSGEAVCDPTTPYSNPFAFSTVGDYILRYKAEDLAGNISTATSADNHLKVDTTAPTIGDDYGVKDSVWQNTDQTITLSAADSESGVSWIKYCTDSISCTPTTVYDANSKPVISISKGTIYFRYNAQDNAGNTQSTVTRIVKIDKTPPSAPPQFQNTTIVTNVINNVTERIASIISPAPAIHNNLGDLPPVEQAVPKQTPLVFLNNWQVVPVAPLKNFLVSLPESLQSLTRKFPQLVKSFEKISDGKPINVNSISSASFKLPTLSETLTFGTDLKFNNLSVALPLDKMEKKQLAKIPSEVVFVRSSNQKIDYGVNFTLDSNENVRPRIEITVNKPIQLSIKPDKPVTSVDGYFVLMKTNAKPLTSRNSLVAAAAVSNSQPSSVIKKGTTVSQFQYEKADNGMYTSDITTPSVDGEYKIVTVLNYQDPNLKPKEIEMSALIDPEGYVFEQLSSGKMRIFEASVSLYWLNPANNTYELWPASDYSQYNPQITDDTGKYSFLVPTGNYYLTVDKEGYKPWKSEIFSVQSGSAVYQNIEMKKESWVSNLWSWVRGKK